MSKFYRYRLPPWLRKIIFIVEKALIPVLIFQLLRTLFFPSTLDLFILSLLICLFIVFYLEWL